MQRYAVVVGRKLADRVGPSQISYDSVGAAAPYLRKAFGYDAEAIGDLYSGSLCTCCRDVGSLLASLTPS